MLYSSITSYRPAGAKAIAVSRYVTRPEKTDIIYIYTKYTYSYYGAYLIFCVTVCVHAIQVVLNSLGFSVYMIKFVLHQLANCYTFERLKFKSNFTCR